MTLGEILHEHNGKRVIPPLIRTPDGLAEQQPTPCPRCGAAEHLVGWHACNCRSDALMGGHRTWICKACDHRQSLGCLGETSGAVR